MPLQPPPYTPLPVTAFIPPPPYTVPAAFVPVRVPSSLLPFHLHQFNPSFQPAPRTWSAAIYGNIALAIHMVFGAAQPAVAVESYEMEEVAGGDAV